MTSREFTTIEELLRRQLPLLQPENTETRRLFDDLARAKQCGWFRKAEFRKMWEWKNSRSRFAGYLRQYSEANSSDKIRSVSREVFATTDDAKRMKLLESLSGVGVPTASAILMFIDPNNYGVIDMHVWRLLYVYDLVNTKPAGKHLDRRDWEQYIDILRRLKSHFTCSARAIERTLFHYDKHRSNTC